VESDQFHGIEQLSLIWICTIFLLLISIFSIHLMEGFTALFYYDTPDTMYGYLIKTESGGMDRGKVDLSYDNNTENS